MSVQLATPAATPARTSEYEDAELTIRFLKLAVQQLLDEIQRLFDFLDAGGDRSDDRWEVVAKIDALLGEANTYFDEAREELERLGV